MIEIWKAIPGWEKAYEVSSYGCVRSLNRTVLRSDKKPYTLRAQELKQEIDKDGYRKVRLWYAGVTKKYFVHRLLGFAFLNLTDKFQINHKDGNPANNYIENLEVCTGSANIKHAYRTGLKIAVRGEKHYRAKLTEQDVQEIKQHLAAESLSNKELSMKYQVAYLTIYAIATGENWKHVNTPEIPDNSNYEVLK